MLLQDTDSGWLCMATIIEMSFADLGLDSVPAFPPWAQAPSHGCWPYQGSHGVIVDDHKSLHHIIWACHKVGILNLHEGNGTMIQGIVNKRIQVLHTAVKDRVQENSWAFCCHLGMIWCIDRQLALTLETWLNSGVGPPLVLLPHCNMQVCQPWSLLQWTLALMLGSLLLSLHLLLLCFLLPESLVLLVVSPHTLAHLWNPELISQAALELMKAKWFLKGGGVTSIYNWESI
jgi:hypothetical protein